MLVARRSAWRGGAGHRYDSQSECHAIHTRARKAKKKKALGKPCQGEAEGFARRGA